MDRAENRLSPKDKSAQNPKIFVMSRHTRERWREHERKELAPQWVQEAEKLKQRNAREPRPLEESVAFNTRRREAIAGRPKPKHCEVCGSDQRISFDHCHASEKFRGWICQGCNTALGMVKDNPATLRALASYLERFVETKDQIPSDRVKPQPLEPFQPEMHSSKSGVRQKRRFQKYAYQQ